MIPNFSALTLINSFAVYAHPLLFAGSYFAVSQIFRVARRTKMHRWYPSMDRSIRIFRHLEQIFEPYRIMFNELKERKSSSHRSISAKKRETLKNTKTLFSGTVNDSRIFAFRGESRNPNAAKTKSGCTRMQLAVC
jgi:hypothetical protein